MGLEPPWQRVTVAPEVVDLRDRVTRFCIPSLRVSEAHSGVWRMTSDDGRVSSRHRVGKILGPAGESSCSCDGLVGSVCSSYLETCVIWGLHWLHNRKVS